MEDHTSCDLVQIAKRLAEEVDAFHFSQPVTHVYNPLHYAFGAHRQYLEKYGRRSCEVLLVGMNPGPWGMAQTGVPFGDTLMVRDFLGIDAHVATPEHEHPKRPITGLGCSRSEVSGTRLWSWSRDIFGSADAFFNRFFVANYCPLVFMESTGRNRTPDKLPAGEKTPLFEACDRALRAMVAWLQPEFVIGIGAFAESRILAAVNPDPVFGPEATTSSRVAAPPFSPDIATGRILHPSPASPAANRDWSGKITAQFEAMGISLPS